MKIAGYLRRFGAATRARDLRALATPDLFHESEDSDRRKTFLILVIARLARRAKCDVGNVSDLSENELTSIQVSLSKQIAEAKSL
jgi:hypothetical protein